jgi:hypothetical protein
MTSYEDYVELDLDLEHEHDLDPEHGPELSDDETDSMSESMNEEPQGRRLNVYLVYAKPSMGPISADVVLGVYSTLELAERQKDFIINELKIPAVTIYEHTLDEEGEVDVRRM